LYSAVLGLFVPSGGSKWGIEAPYLLQAANELKVNLGSVVQIYNAAEALPNRGNPFWMPPLLGLLGGRPRDLVAYAPLELLEPLRPVLRRLVRQVRQGLGSGQGRRGDGRPHRARRSGDAGQRRGRRAAGARSVPVPVAAGRVRAAAARHGGPRPGSRAPARTV